MAEHPPAGETGIIQTYFAPLAADTPGAFGLNDDAGLIQPPDGFEIVLTTDMIIGGIHYLDNAAPQDIAYKALGVNVSDLCAKGADPAVYLLSIALPENPDPAWLEGLRDGFAEAQSDFGCMLLGGDTVHTTGPVAISITAAGHVPEKGMVRRSGAEKGDFVYVTGTIGDAALGLLLMKESTGTQTVSREQADHLKSRYRRPQPRMSAIALVREHANAAMDISDGLVGDFSKLCAASGAGGVLNAADVPLSSAAAAWLGQRPSDLEHVLTGGDDYEILMCVSQKHTAPFEDACAAHGLQVTRIGEIVSPDKDGVRVLDRDGSAIKFAHQSYDHF